MTEFERMKNEKLVEEKVRILDKLLDTGYEVLSSEWYIIKSKVMEAKTKEELDLI